MTLTAQTRAGYIAFGAGGYAPLSTVKRACRMKHLCFVACGLVLAATSARAQVEVPASTETTGQAAADAQTSSLYNSATPFRLLDPSRLTMNHSYSLSYFSGPAGGQSVGMYMNSIGYQIARPLYLQVDLALVHDPGAIVSGGNATAGARILPNFSLRYTPSPKFNLLVDVRTMPTYNSPYAGYYPGYGSSYWIR